MQLASLGNCVCTALCVYFSTYFQIVNKVLTTRVDVNGRLESFRKWCTWCKVKKRILLAAAAVCRPDDRKSSFLACAVLQSRSSSMISFQNASLQRKKCIRSCCIALTDVVPRTRCWSPSAFVIPKLVAALPELCCYSSSLFTPGVHGDPNLLNFLISPDLNEATNEGRDHLTTMTVDLNGNSFRNCYSRQLGRWICFSIGDGN